MYSKCLRGVLQKFCVADPFSAKSQQLDLKPKKVNYPRNNLLFNIIAIPARHFLYRAMSLLMPPAYHTGFSFFSKKLVPAFFRLSSTWNHCSPKRSCRPGNVWKSESVRLGKYAAWSNASQPKSSKSLQITDHYGDKRCRELQKLFWQFSRLFLLYHLPEPHQRIKACTYTA